MMHVWCHVVPRQPCPLLAHVAAVLLPTLALALRRAAPMALCHAAPLCPLPCRPPPPPQEMKRGVEFETKASLMKKAEASGLSNKPLFSQAGPSTSGMARAGGERHYDGWSSLTKVRERMRAPSTCVRACALHACKQDLPAPTRPCCLQPCLCCAAHHLHAHTSARARRTRTVPGEPHAAARGGVEQPQEGQAHAAGGRGAGGAAVRRCSGAREGGGAAGGGS